MTEELRDIGNMTEEQHARCPTGKLLLYAAAMTSASGKRVLDIDCGNGDGTFLLKKWGAAEVVGVDLAKHPPASEPKESLRRGVRFLQSNPTQLADVLAGEQFDLIICGDSVGHLSQMSRLLRIVKSLAAPGAMIFVSFPNEHSTDQPGRKDRTRLGKTSFDVFRKSAEAALGTTPNWWAASKSQGHALRALGNPLKKPTSNETMTYPMVDALGVGYFLPDPPNTSLTTDSIIFYVGAWGNSAEHGSAMPLSVHPYPSNKVDASFHLSTEIIAIPQLIGSHTPAGLSCSEVKLPSNLERSVSTDLQQEVARLRRRMIALSETVASAGMDTRQLAQTLSAAHDQIAEATLTREQALAELQRILHSRGHRLLDWLYYRFFRTPWTQLVASDLRDLCSWVLRRVGIH